MQALQDIYIQNPFWIWMAVGAVFVALDIATGTGKLIWPGVAAAVLAFLNLSDIRLGATVEGGLFLAVSAVGLAFSLGFGRKKPSASPDDALFAERDLPETVTMPSADRTGRLIGRIGRTTGEFANGVGRVYIDGAEWGAELDGSEVQLPSDAPVRVMGVTGGIRLQVRGLMG